MTSEEQNALGTVGMEMMHGIPVGVSTGLHPYGSSMTLSTPDSQPTTQERESLYNMVVHHVMPNASADTTPVDTKIPLPTETAVSAATAVSIGKCFVLCHARGYLMAGVTASGTEQNLTKLLQVSEPVSVAAAQNEALQAISTTPSVVGVQGGVDMLQSVCAAPGWSMDIVCPFSESGCFREQYAKGTDVGVSLRLGAASVECRRHYSFRDEFLLHDCSVALARSQCPACGAADGFSAASRSDAATFGRSSIVVDRRRVQGHSASCQFSIECFRHCTGRRVKCLSSIDQSQSTSTFSNADGAANCHESGHTIRAIRYRYPRSNGPSSEGPLRS